MVNKLKLLLVALLCVAAMPTAMAQITEGNPTANTIRTGNRPEAGNFGLYLGASSSMFESLFSEDITMKALPLINFKYMSSDKLELRVGVELFRSMEKVKGTIDLGESTTQDQNLRSTRGYAMLYPGFAYHFSSKNILDVYVGAELPFGWNRYTYLGESEDYRTKTTKSSFTIGLGAFIGVQAFIANLPLAIGIEYGLSSRLDTSLKYKSETTMDNKTQTFYAPDIEQLPLLGDNLAEAYEELSAKKGTLGSQFRLTLSYYFK